MTSDGLIFARTNGSYWPDYDDDADNPDGLQLEQWLEDQHVLRERFQARCSGDHMRSEQLLDLLTRTGLYEDNQACCWSTRKGYQFFYYDEPF